MNNKYIKPVIQVASIYDSEELLGSSATEVQSNAGITGAGPNGTIIGGSEPARSRTHSIWEEE